MAGFKNNRLVNSNSIEKIQKFNFIDKEQWKYTNFNHLSSFTFNEHFNENLLSIDTDDSTDLLFLNELSNKLNNIEQKADEVYEKIKKKKKDKKKKKKIN